MYASRRRENRSKIPALRRTAYLDKAMTKREKRYEKAKFGVRLSMIRTACSAFTLLEVLVVVGILSIVLGLAVVAIAKVRHTANRLSCSNNLRQIGLGIYQHVFTYNGLPSNGGWDGRQTIIAENGSQTKVHTDD